MTTVSIFQWVTKLNGLVQENIAKMSFQYVIELKRVVRHFIEKLFEHEVGVYFTKGLGFVGRKVPSLLDDK